MIRTARIAANNLEFETLMAGQDGAPLLLFLHGFPEYAGAWTDMLPKFADKYLAVAPNQRGYATSSKPAGVDNYRVNLLATDMLQVAERFSPGRRFHLVAHDWGASVGYMMSFMAPQKLASFTVCNGVHPVPFQRALIEDPAQRLASQYIRFLRRDDSAKILTENNCERLLQMLRRGFDGGRWMTDAMRKGYLEAWQQPWAMEAMVSWYKATPLVVGAPEEEIDHSAGLAIDLDKVRVRMPHQVIWGTRDTALLQSARKGLDALCSDLTVHEFPDADHWIVHQKPAEVSALIGSFIDKHAGRL